jgi:hypothetical protein
MESNEACGVQHFSFLFITYSADLSTDLSSACLVELEEYMLEMGIYEDED